MSVGQRKEKIKGRLRVTPDFGLWAHLPWSQRTHNGSRGILSSGILSNSTSHSACPLLTYYNFVDSQDEDALFKAEAVLPGEELLPAPCWDKHLSRPRPMAAAIGAGADGSSECYIDTERNTAFELKLEGGDVFSVKVVIWAISSALVP